MPVRPTRMRTLRTARLVLRPFKEADQEPHSAIWYGPKVGRFLSSAQLREDCILFEGPVWREGAKRHGFVPRAVVEQRSGRLLGHAGVRIVPELRAPELHVLLDSRVWGRGYATEAGAAVLADAFRAHDLAFVLGLAAAGHGAARRVLEKLGFVATGPVTAWGTALDAFRLDRR